MFLARHFIVLNAVIATAFASCACAQNNAAASKIQLKNEYQKQDEYASFSKEELFSKVFSDKDVKLMRKSSETYATLYINNQYFDELEIELKDEDAFNQTIHSIYSERLVEFFEESLKPEINEKLVIEDGKYLISSINDVGIKADFIRSSMHLILTIPVEVKVHREINLRQDRRWFDDIEAIGPAEKSGFINFFLETKLLERKDILNSNYTNHSPSYVYPIDKFSGLSKYVFNYKNWVLDGYSIINFRDSDTKKVTRGKTKVTKPLEKNARFISFGDLEYKTKGFLDYKPMLGISYYTDFYAQPYFQTQYLGQESIFLPNPAEVEIFVNNHKTKTLNLDSGSYDLKEFALNEGVNDVSLKIKDQTGYTEVQNFSLVTYQNNLRKGLHEYSYNIGLESRLTSPNSYSDDPRAVFYHRYGLTNNFTIGGSGSFNEKTQLLSLAGTYGMTKGLLHYDAALWRAKHYDGYDYNLGHIFQYVHNTSGEHLKSLMIQGRKFGANFKRINYRPIEFNSIRRRTVDWDFNLLSNWNMEESSSLALSFRTTKYYDDDRLKSKLIASFFRRFGGLRFRLSGQYDFRDNDLIILASLSRSFGRNRYAANYDSDAKKYALEYSRYPISRTKSVALNADAQFYEDGQKTLHYDTSYSTYRAKFDLFGRYLNAYRNEYDNHELGMHIATALVYADGKFAISRPVSNSFAIVSYENDNAFKGMKLGINPVTEGEKIFYSAQINKFGAAVITDMSNYLYQDIRLDTAALPTGYIIEQSKYTLLPEFFTGIKLELDNIVQIIGNAQLKFPDSNNMSLVTGFTSTQSGSKQSTKRNLFFSDRLGMVQFDGLEPGKCTIEAKHDGKTYSAEFEIPEFTKGGVYQLGEIMLYEVEVEY